MREAGSNLRVFRFGPFEVDLLSGELRRQGLRIRLPDQPFRILEMLLEHAGEPVTREQLRQRLWPTDTFVDFDNSLNAAVNRLRETLGDSAEKPRFIETLPRRGYRFIFPAESVERLPAAVQKTSTSPAFLFRSLWLRRFGWAGAFLVLAVALIAYFAVNHSAIRGGRTTLAVLPLENLTGDQQEEYFSDGMTEELITQLGRLQPDRLGVVARSSVMRYRRGERKLDRIGHDLNAEYVLEGSVRRSGSRVRITAQLIRVQDQTHVWAQDYDRDLGDILSLESEVAQAVAQEIRVKLSPQTQTALTQPHRVNPQAYEAYLRGRYLWNQRRAKSLSKAMDYFHQAIEKDPSYSLPYAGLADSYIIMGNFGMLRPTEAYPQAKLAARRALEIDPSLGEADTALAFATYLFDRDWATAEKGFQRAIQRNPDYGPAHQWYGVCLVARGRNQEALAEATFAQQAEPLSLIINAVAGWISYLARRYDSAIQQCNKTLDLAPDFSPAHLYLGLAYTQKGMFEQSVRELQTAVRSDDRPLGIGALGYAYARAGRRNDAMRLLREMKQRSQQNYFPAYEIAIVYAGLGDKEQAFEWLQRADEERYPWLIHLNAEPRLDELHSDPRFRSLVMRVGLQR